jgi:hypothetical protein
MARHAKRNAKIVTFYKANKWSYQLVADTFGVSRNVVAGLIFRDTYPVSVRKKASGQSNKIGTGRRGGCRYFPKYHALNSNSKSAAQVSVA